MPEYDGCDDYQGAGRTKTTTISRMIAGGGVTASTTEMGGERRRRTWEEGGRRCGWFGVGYEHGGGWMRGGEPLRTDEGYRVNIVIGVIE